MLGEVALDRGVALADADQRQVAEPERVAVGTELVVFSSQGPAVAILDIRDPAAPRPIAGDVSSISSLGVGRRFIGATGRRGNAELPGFRLPMAVV